MNRWIPFNFDVLYASFDHVDIVGCRYRCIPLRGEYMCYSLSCLTLEKDMLFENNTAFLTLCLVLVS